MCLSSMESQNSSGIGLVIILMHGNVSVLVPDREVPSAVKVLVVMAQALN